MIALYIIGGILGAWLLLCALVWSWYCLAGHKEDHSGDMGLAVAFLPILPFIWLYGKFRGNK